MSANRNPIFIDARQTWPVDIVAGDGSTPKNLVTVGADGGVIEALSLASTDLAMANVLFWISHAGQDYPVGVVPVPAGAGTDGSTPAVNGLDAQYFPWLTLDGIIPLGPGSTFKAGVLVAVTGVVSVVALGGDF